MDGNADFSNRAAVHAARLDWSPPLLVSEINGIDVVDEV